MFWFYSQQGTIMRAMKVHKRLPVSFFMKWKYYVGYKWWTRICELVTMWYLRRSEIDEIGSKGQRFATYALTAKWFNCKIKEATWVDRMNNFFNF